MRARPPRPRRLALPRWLLLGWSAWLLASWYLSFGQYRAISIDSDAHLAAVRQMLVSIALWIGLAWPLFRLGGRPLRAPRLTCFVDFLAIVGTFQVVVWPMRLLTPWPVSTVVLVDLMIIAWALVMSGVIAWTLITSDSLRNRLLWTAVCLAILLTGPTVTYLSLVQDPAGVALHQEAMYWSPVSAMWMLASRTEALVGEAEWIRLILLTVVGLLLWTGALLWPRRAIPRPPEPLPPAANSGRGRRPRNRSGFGVRARGGPLVRELPRRVKTSDGRAAEATNAGQPLPRPVAPAPDTDADGAAAAVPEPADPPDPPEPGPDPTPRHEREPCDGT